MDCHANLSAVQRNRRIPCRMAAALIGLAMAADALTVAAQEPVPVLRAQPDLLLLRDGRVAILERLEDGSLLAAGNIDWANGQAVGRGVVRLQADGTPVPGWQASPVGSPSFVIWLNHATATNCGDWIYVAGTLASPSGGDDVNLRRIDRETGVPDLTWTSAVTGNISALACDGSGHLLVAGEFLFVAGARYHGLVRLVADSGAHDPSWTVQASGRIQRLLVAADGSVYVVGRNTFGTPAQYVVRNGLARVLPNGAVDPDWDPAQAFPNTGWVSAIALGEDGWLYVGGRLAIESPPRHGVLRVSTSGSGAIDPTWHPNPDWPTALNGERVDALHVDGPWLYVGGWFDRFGGLARASMARVSTIDTGQVDPAWDSPLRPDASLGNTLVAIVPGPGDSLWAAGQLRSTGTTPSTGLVRVARADGTRIGSHRLALAGNVLKVAVHPAGGVVLAGDYFHADGMDREGLLRLDASGGIDPAFAPAVTGEVKALAVDAAGRVHVGGDLHHPDLPQPLHLLRLQANSDQLDTTWVPAVDGTVDALAFDPDGRLHVGGAFGQVAGQAQARLARFDATGAFDVDWRPVVTDSPVVALAFADDWVYIGAGYGNLRRFARAAPGHTDLTWHVWIGEWFLPSLFVRAGGPLVVAHGRTVFNRPDGSISLVSQAPGTPAQTLWQQTVPWASPVVAGGATGPMFGATIAAGQRIDYELFRFDESGTLGADWRPQLDRSVAMMQRSTDGVTLWVTGQFSRIDGERRFGLAAFDLRGDALFENAFD